MPILSYSHTPSRLNSYLHPPPSLSLRLCFLLCYSYSLAFFSVTETMDDRVSDRIFPMAVIAHARESRLCREALFTL